MNMNKTPVQITLWFNRGIFLLFGVLILTMPTLTYWYQQCLIFSNNIAWTILAAFYCCAPMVALALWKLDKLLLNILRGDVFVSGNVAAIRALRWCCLGVCLVCLPASVIYLPLIFMVVIMGFLSLVVNVVCQVMKAAVAIREENDLTV